MLEYLRHHQKSILLVVTIVICITFGWFYVKVDTGGGGQGSMVLGTIYGKKIDQRDYAKMQNHVTVASQLQLPAIEELAADSTRDSLMPYVASVYMVREEAAKLGLAVTDEEIESFIRTLPAFQTNGNWDPMKFNLYAGTGNDNGLLIERASRFGQMETSGPFKLSRLGMTVADLYEVFGDYMLFDKMRELLGAGLSVSPFESEKNHSIFNQQMKASIIRFPFSAHEATIQVSDEEIAKHFEENKESYMTDEKRSIEFVAIEPEKAPVPPAPEVKPGEPAPSPAPEAPVPESPEKAKARALLAGNIFDALSDGIAFADAVKDKGLTVVAVPPFSVSETPEALKGKNVLLGKINALTNDGRIPPPVRDGETWYVFRLKELLEPTVKPLEEVKAEITAEIKQTKVLEAAMAAAKEAAGKITPMIAEGKSFAEAAEAAGLKAEELPVIKGASSPKVTPEQRMVRTALQLAKPMTLAEPVAGQDVVLLPFLTSREIVKSPEKAATIASMSNYGTQQLRQAVFMEWWKGRRSEAEFKDNTKPESAPEAGAMTN